MKALVSLLSLSLLLAACGPSKEEILRQQILAQQRAEIARLEAQTRAQRAQERLLAAQQQLANKADISALGLAATGKLLDNVTPTKSYYFDIGLQADKYNYGQELQSFAIIGMRIVNSQNLELILASEKTENHLYQTIEKPSGKRLSALMENIKQQNILLKRDNNWRWNASNFNDFDWLVGPEEAWDLTSKAQLNMQLELRFCALGPCQSDYNYQGHPTTSYQAEVLSLLIYRTDNRKILASFVSDRP